LFVRWRSFSASVKGLNLAASICIGAGLKEASRATVPKLGVVGDFFFMAMFEQTIVASNCLGDGFTK
jgi:hypothetical protein